MKRLINRLGSVRLYSVCPMDLQQRRHATGLLLNAQRAGDIDGQQALALSSNGAALSSSLCV